MTSTYEFKISVQWYNHERISEFEKTFNMKLPVKARIHVTEDFKSRIARVIEFLKEPTFHSVRLSSSVRSYEDSSRIEFLDENDNIIEVPYYSDFGEEEHRKVVDEDRIILKCDKLYGVVCEILFRNAYTELAFQGTVKELSSY